MRLHLFLFCYKVVVKLLRGGCEVLCFGIYSVELCGVGGWSSDLETVKS